MSDILYEGLTEEQIAKRRRGEEYAIGMLLDWYRRDAKHDFYHSGTNIRRNAERLDMISCVCEFLDGFMTYRFDTNTERLFLQNDGKPHSDYCWRWPFPISNSELKIMQRRLHGSLNQLNKKIDSYKSQIDPDVEIGMRNVSRQVQLLVDNYPAYSLLIQNDPTGNGLGIDLYTTLNMYRRIASGHSAHDDPQPE